MWTLSMRLLLFVAAVAGLGGPVQAASFGAQADVVNAAGNPRASASQFGDGPVTATTGPAVSNDGQRSGQATASALRGAVEATGLSASTLGKVTSIGAASATFDDLLFVFSDPGVPPGTLPVATLNYSLLVAQTLSGPALAGQNARDASFTVSFAGASDGGVVDFQAGSGLSQLGGRQLTATNVPVGIPVTLSLSLQAGAAAASGGNGLVQSAINAALQVGRAQAGGASSAPADAASPDAGAPASAPEDPLVFDLPPGFTVFSPSMGIVDNRLVAAPPADADGDGVGDGADNCPFAANADQADRGGVGAGSPPDGVGDACQCGDVNGDGLVTLADAAAVQRSLLQPPTATLAVPALCDVDGNLACTLADAVRLRRALLQPPTATIQQGCAPTQP